MNIGWGRLIVALLLTYVYKIGYFITLVDFVDSSVTKFRFFKRFKAAVGVCPAQMISLTASHRCTTTFITIQNNNLVYWSTGIISKMWREIFLWVGHCLLRKFSPPSRCELSQRKISPEQISWIAKLTINYFLCINPIFPKKVTITGTFLNYA